MIEMFLRALPNVLSAMFIGSVAGGLVQVCENDIPKLKNLSFTLLKCLSVIKPISITFVLFVSSISTMLVYTTITTITTMLAVSYKHLRAKETDYYLLCRLLLEKK